MYITLSLGLRICFCDHKSPTRKPVPAWASLSKKPQVLPGSCSSMGCPQGHSLLWVSLCSGIGCGYLHLHRSPWISMGCTEDCRDISALVPGTPPAAPSLLLVVLLTDSHSSLLWPQIFLHTNYFPFLN